jgi:serine/threonine-protein kinase HipA
MKRTLNVFLKKDLVGELEQDKDGALHFRYAEGWLNSKPAIPLSASLPLQKERFGRKLCRPFFAGLLPEQTNRELIAKSFGVSDKNDFAILEKIGAECAGAVSILAPGEIPPAEDPSYREITLDELAKKFTELPAHPLLTGTEGIRLSLAGAQGKLVVAIRTGKFNLPLGGAPSSHILKPPSAHYEQLVGNEFFCMRLAKRIGLDVADVELGKAGDTSFLQVKRFDREEWADGLWERIHQEDFCQAFGIPPELKYQQEGGPNLKRCFALVRSVSSVPGPDVLKLFDAVIFNFLIGNSDAHGKNFSFLYTVSGARLAPLYDLVSTQVYPQLSENMAMKIGDAKAPSKIETRDWRKFFEDAALGQAQAVQRLLNFTKQVRDEALAMSNEVVTGSQLVSPAVVARCDTLLSRDWEKR